MLTEEQPAVFWPDHWPLDRKARCWKLLTEEQSNRMTYNTTQESGQILVDKRYCLSALSVCGKINVQLHSQLKRLFPEPFNNGDKDTWHFSFLSANTPFLMIPHRPGCAGTRDTSGQYTGTTVLQKDQSGEVVFLHKMRAKWATQTHEPQWTDVYHFLNPTRGRVHPWTMRFEDGPVVREAFNEAFGQLEQTCWTALRGIRESDWYKNEFANALKDLLV